MRKVLLVLTLIGASFAGGAVVNGPGLAWLRNSVGLSPLKIGYDPFEEDRASDEGAAHDTEPRLAERVGTRRARGKMAEAASAKALPADSTATSAPARSDSAASVPSTAASPASENAPPPLEAPSLAQGVNAQAPSEAGEAKDGENATQASAEASPASPRDGALSRTADLPQHAAGSADAAASESASTSTDAPTWSDIVSKLKAQGVSRYWIEGEPGGVARFRCVVPLVERGTVGQQFESEAGDVVNAADMALRRVILWKAGEAP